MKKSKFALMEGCYGIYKETFVQRIFHKEIRRQGKNIEHWI